MVLGAVSTGLIPADSNSTQREHYPSETTGADAARGQDSESKANSPPDWKSRRYLYQPVPPTGRVLTAVRLG